MSSKRHAWSDRRDETAVVLACQSVTDADDLGSRSCCTSLGALACENCAAPSPPIPGLPEVPGAVDPQTTTKTRTCLTPPRPVIWCKSSDDTASSAPAAMFMSTWRQ